MATTPPVRTTCPYCGVGCGVLVGVDEAGGRSLRGDPEHPANHGRLCSKGTALLDTLDASGRLLAPRVQGREVDWDSALETVAGGLRRVVERHGPDAVAFYVSGQLLTEDYYVANKLMKGFIGSANIDTNSRLCMASAVAAHHRAFGTDTVPCSYEDLEQAELVVLVGSNTAWCHPVLFQRLRRAREQRPELKVVVVDPRRTPTCELADLHLPLRPGTDVLLFNGLLSYLRREDALDWEFLEARTEGFAAALKAAKASGESIPAVAAACALDPEEVGRFYRWFARSPRTVTLFSQGVNQSSAGTDKANAIINCHLATGRIGRPGAGPFSITGQPNAMGGREVGGLASQLAAHMDFRPENLARLRRFWDSPGVARRPGLKAVELFEAIGSGRVKAVWIMATNPLVSLPDADAARAALASCDLVIVSDCQCDTDTARLAHVLLPATTWGEKDGTVTNSERRISRQRAFLDPPGQARPDWWIVTQVARRMGFAQAFPYGSPAQIFREHAALSAFENDGARAFDIGALAGLDDAEYAALPPLRWPLNGICGATPFADGRFYTPSGRARLVAVEPRPPGHLPDEDFPLVLNTGRVRDHWHTLTRTGKSPRLSAHRPEPLLGVHPEDALRYGVRAGGIARVWSRWGEALARVEVSTDLRPGSVFLPMHWGREHAARACAGALVAPVTDPVSGEPEFKHTPVRIAPYPARWHGFLLSREPVDLDGLAAYRVRIRAPGLWRYELVDERPGPPWPEQARRLAGEGEWVEFEDRAAGRYRGARIEDGRLQACLFVAPDLRLPAREPLCALFERPALAESDRAGLLAGGPSRGRAGAGPLVCACFGVGRDTLVDAIESRGLRSTEAIGTALQAGTGCGSCLPELRELLALTRR